MFTTVLFASMLIGVDADPQGNWPGFRGDGSSTSPTTRLPLAWSPDANIAWRTPLPGYGQSSPVAWGGHAYVTAIDGPNKEKLIVAAVETATGKLAWQKEFAAKRTGKNNPLMSRAAPTPVTDADGVYCLFESGDLVALTHGGAEVWRRSLCDDYGDFKNNHGLGSSLAQTGRALILQADHAGPSYLLALDKVTGKELWKAERPSKTSWASPVVTRVGGKPAVVVSGGGTLVAYDAHTGTEFANVGGLVGNAIPSPTAAGDLVLVGAGEERMKPDAAASTRSNCCLRLTPEGFTPVWQAKGRLLSQHASPLIYRGHAYFVSKTGLVHCLDLKTGEERYAERLADPCWATPIGAGGDVYFFGKSGVTTVLKAGPDYDKLATNRLWSADDSARRLEIAKKDAEATLPKPPAGKGPGGGPAIPKAELDQMRTSAVGDVVYGVAATGDSFLIRTGTELFCIRNTPGDRR